MSELRLRSSPSETAEHIPSRFSPSEKAEITASLPDPRDFDYGILCPLTDATRDGGHVEALRKALSAAGFHVKTTDLHKQKKCLVQFHLPLVWLVVGAAELRLKMELASGLYQTFTPETLDEFKGAQRPDQLFPPRLRQRLTQHYLERLEAPFTFSGTTGDGKMRKEWEVRSGEPLVAALKAQRLLDACSPLHHRAAHRDLHRRWVWQWSWREPWGQPLGDVRDYYGDRVALYFAFLGAYTKWLTLPAAAGLLLGARNYIAGIRTSHSMPQMVYALGVPVWSMLFLKFWYRKRARLNRRWVDELDHAALASSLAEARHLRMRQVSTLLSEVRAALLLGALLVAGAALTAVFEHTVPCVGQQGGAICLTGSELDRAWWGLPSQVVGQVHTVLYVQAGGLLIALTKRLAARLNAAEQHVDDQHAEERLQLKVFGMYFVVYYSTLMYYAFVLRDMRRLRTFLQSLMIMKQVISLVKEVLLPLLQHVWGNWWRNRKAAKAEGDERRAEEIARRLQLPEYEGDNDSGLFDDMLEMCLQFGYTSMFSAAYPPAALLAFLNNLVEIRSDAYKISRLMRRPEAKHSRKLGSWMYLFEFIATVSILTNTAIVAFTSRELDEPPWSLTPMGKLVAMVAVEHLLVALKLAVQTKIHSVPMDVCRTAADQEALDEGVKRRQADVQLRALARAGRSLGDEPVTTRVFEALVSGSWDKPHSS